eukprot:Skav203219  [mRNA]  locus=scaffold2292:86486:98187:+ [translate_table: standard]
MTAALARQLCTADPTGGVAQPMAVEPQFRRPRFGRRLCVLAAGVLALCIYPWQAPADGDAFAAATAQVAQLRSSCRDDSAVAMQGGNRRQNRRNQPKKCHPKYQEARFKKWAEDTPAFVQRLFFVPEATLEDWSHTLKLNFPEGEEWLLLAPAVPTGVRNHWYYPED